jgi:cation transport regulator ChaB
MENPDDMDDMVDMDHSAERLQKLLPEVNQFPAEIRSQIEERAKIFFENAFGFLDRFVDEDVGVGHTERLLNLLLKENQLPTEIRTQIKEQVKIFFLDGCVEVYEEVGAFLRFSLNDDEHSEDEVRKLLQSFPESLSWTGDEDPLTIQVAAIYDEPMTSFIPLLAEEGLKHNIGGEGMRGGLLCEDRNCCNVLQVLANEKYADETKYLNVMRRLREMDLLKKEDIQEYKLLETSCFHDCKERFQFIVEWDPDALAGCTSRGITNRPLIHIMLYEYESFDGFEMGLEAGIAHFPHELGFLFCERDNSISASNVHGSSCLYDDACAYFGLNETWTIVERCLTNLFGTNTSASSTRTSTDLYPFMIAASKGTVSKNLDVIYYLIRKDPRVVEDALLSSHEDDANRLEASGDIDTNLKRKRGS